MPASAHRAWRLLALLVPLAFVAHDGLMAIDVHAATPHHVQLVGRHRASDHHAAHAVIADGPPTGHHGAPMGAEQPKPSRKAPPPRDALLCPAVRAPLPRAVAMGGPGPVAPTVAPVVASPPILFPSPGLRLTRVPGPAPPADIRRALLQVYRI